MSMKLALALAATHDNPIIRANYEASDPWDTGLACPPEEARTVQSEKNHVDINVIMKKARRNNTIPIFPYAKQGWYGDATQLPSFMEAQQILANTKNYFSRLPSHLRQKFDNNPAALLDYLANPANAKEAAELGLRPKSEEAAPPAPTPPAPPAPSTGSGTAPGV